MISVLLVGKCDYTCKANLVQTARAFGASELAFVGEEDKKLKRYVSELNATWGGAFSVVFIKDYMAFIKSKASYKKVYLTRYGTQISKSIYMLRTYKNLLVILTMKEANKAIMRASDFHVSITTQPHSSASALAVFLHMFYEGRELAMHFENAKVKIKR
ncbi:MAG: hypothetical protein ACP5K5_00475 [Candidatus Micrarchaeia archaeon]